MRRLVFGDSVMVISTFCRWPRRRGVTRKTGAPRIQRHTRCEALETRAVLSTIAFTTHEIEVNNFKDALTRSGSYVANTADIDGDGDLDIVTAMGATTEHREFGSIEWYENRGKAEGFASGREIATSAHRVTAIVLADFDDDGDVDVAASGGDEKWYPNLDGRGNFGPGLLFPSYAFGLIVANDFDGDGDLDLINEVCELYFNTDGSGTFGTRRTIDGCNGEAQTSIIAADIDGDRDSDLVVVGEIGVWDVYWLENVDGQGSFGVARPIEEHGRSRNVYAVDIDGDTDLDIVVGGVVDFSLPWPQTRVFWYENLDGRGAFGTPREAENAILERNNPPAIGWSNVMRNVKAIDVDGDGDNDLITEVYDPFGSRPLIKWQENLDGLGRFEAVGIIRLMIEGCCANTPFVVPGDIDNDGDIDILTGPKLIWHENRRIGDANDDGVFDSSDFIAVLQAGKYEDGVASGTTFDEGDWNGDGEFDSADLVFALQAGTYRAGP